MYKTKRLDEYLQSQQSLLNEYCISHAIDLWNSGNAWEDDFNLFVEDYIRAEWWIFCNSN